MIPAIQIMENLMSTLDRSELYDEYGMIRIGEEHEDIDEDMDAINWDEED